MGLAKFIYTLGERYRNPSLKKHYKFLKETEQWNKADLQAYQLSSLKKLMQHAYATSPFYRQLYDEHGVHPDTIVTLEDIKRFPVISKFKLLENAADIHSTVTFPKVFKAVTSGTTGQSLKFDREESADSFNRAVIQRGYSWYNVKPWERNGYFWGFNFSKTAQIKTKLLDGLQNRFRLFTYDKVSLKKFHRKLQKASYVHGYSSMIYQVAGLILQEGLAKPKKLKMVKGTSEKIYESYKDDIFEAFGVPIISEYGATESGIIAFECPYGKMHITMEGVLVEEVNHKIVVTNLALYKFPVIRYELGDYIKLADEDEKCSCGMEHRILDEVTGRIGEAVKGNVSSYPSLYFYYIFKNLSEQHNLKLTYYIEQKKKGALVFNIEEELTENHKILLGKEIDKYFKGDITYRIINNVERKRVGKTKSFKSYI